jgi:hypothetical protein
VIHLIIETILAITLILTAYFNRRHFLELDEKLREFRQKFSPMLHYISDKLEEVGEYQERIAGSGEIAYKVNGVLFEFNVYTDEFRGFRIDHEPVDTETFMDEIRRAKEA